MKRSMRKGSVWVGCLLGLGLLGAGAGARAQGTGVPVGEAMAMPPILVVAQAQKQFAELVTPQRRGRLGFTSPDEVLQARQDVPVRDVFIGLEALKQFQAPPDPELLLVPGTRALVPLIDASGAPRALITLHETQGRWQAVAFGSPSLARALVRTREVVAARAGVTPSQLFLLRVPALKLQFVAFRADGRLFVASLVADGRFQLEAGATLPIEDVLNRILPVARDTADLPG
jgi:hypothetical protein